MASDGPLGEPAFLVLTALAAEPLPGYALLEEIERVSQGRTRMRAGTLYAVLDRLRTAGLVEVERRGGGAVALRRYYRLTGVGARRLAGEAERLRRQAQLAGSRLRKLGYMS
jgi:DNA-binding PadR family transcriptional regulator